MPWVKAGAAGNTVLGPWWPVSAGKWRMWFAAREFPGPWSFPAPSCLAGMRAGSPETGGGWALSALSPRRRDMPSFLRLSPVCRMCRRSGWWAQGLWNPNSGVRLKVWAFPDESCGKGTSRAPWSSPALTSWLCPRLMAKGSSGVVKEGWAAGVPVVCSDLPANLELVREESNGLVFANGDPSSLARQLERLLKDSALCEKLVRAGSHDVAPYDVSAMHTAYLRAYASVLFPLP